MLKLEDDNKHLLDEGQLIKVTKIVDKLIELTLEDKIEWKAKISGKDSGSCFFELNGYEFRMHSFYSFKYREEQPEDKRVDIFYFNMPRVHVGTFWGRKNGKIENERIVRLANILEEKYITASRRYNQKCLDEVIEILNKMLEDES